MILQRYRRLEELREELREELTEELTEEEVGVKESLRSDLDGSED